MTKPLLLALGLLSALSPATAANLLTNPSFEADPLGTLSTSGTGGAVDGSTFTDWRFFNVGGPAAAGYTGTIVDAGAYAGGTPGSKAFRFDVDTSNNPGGDRGLDRDSARIPVTFGTSYVFSFDAELDGVTGGDFTFLTLLAEFDSTGAWLGIQTPFSPTLPPDQAFHSYSTTWTPTNTATTHINIAFRPLSPGFINAVVLDNVSFAAVPEPGSLSLMAVAALGLLRRRRA